MARHDHEKLLEVLSLGDPWKKNREFVKGLFKIYGWTLSHDERGDYDSSTDGFLVFYHESTKDYIRVDFEEDSYSDGYFSQYSFVKPQQKTITVWE